MIISHDRPIDRCQNAKDRRFISSRPPSLLPHRPPPKGGPAGHYWPNMDVDPWLVTTYTSDANGVASLSLDVDDYSLQGTNPVAGRTVVFHDATGARIGCGVIEATSGEIVNLGTYPGTTYSPKGTLLITNYLDKKEDGIKITGTMGGLGASSSGGIHIHSGFTCDATVDSNGDDATSTSVGGHYYEGMSTDPCTLQPHADIEMN
jgi:Cu/Zn superoxide dismutase